MRTLHDSGVGATSQVQRTQHRLAMQNQITIDCPPEVLLGVHMNAEGFADYLKKQAAISLFKEGKLSSGTAATWLGISRIAFLSLAFEAGAVLLEDSADDWTRETVLL
jgi:hypothetical protein